MHHRREQQQHWKLSWHQGFPPGSLCIRPQDGSFSPFSDVRRSIKQEVAVRFTCNIHIPSKYSPLLYTHSSSCLRQDSKAFWWLDGDDAWSSEFTAFARCWLQENFHPLGRSQWPWLCGHWHYHEGEGSYWCRWFGATDVLILSL